MATLILGLRFAAIIMCSAKLVNFALDPTVEPPGQRWRHIGIALICGAVVFGFSPAQVAEGFHWHVPHQIAQTLRLFGLALTVAAAMCWLVGRGLLNGGTKRDVFRGALVNVVLVALCIVAAWGLR
jgi:hypothetical protein